MGLNHFRRDDRDTKFVLFEFLDIDRLFTYEAYSDFTREDFSMIVDEGLKVCREVVGPTNQDGDREGLVYDQGAVRVPAGFHQAWRVLSENGWLALGLNPEFGGQGLPMTVAGLVGEFFSGANIALNIYAGLAAGSGHLIEAFGTDKDRSLFCENMYGGRWAGTMCLTEPDAGSDVGWLRTKASPDPESGDPRVYRIEGSKRFISGGEHDLTENIIHLVLARIEGSPAGTRGISLFVVPKFWVNDDGGLGRDNDVFCAGIEEKMGLHGSSTCTLNFGENGQCRGILLGEPDSGMAKMFQMMNEARMGTGVLALGLAAGAYDSVRLYARERVQGPLFTDRKGDRVPIIRHEDVRRMLMNLKSGVEAMRAMVGKIYWLIDVSRHDPDEEARLRADFQAELLTPLVKAYCSDYGYELIRDAIQLMGGVGYCREFPVEQYARDIKSASIYEGTTYIQALDLIGRKVPLEGGRIFGEWIGEARSLAEANAGDADFGSDFALLERAAGVVEEFSARFMTFFTDGRLGLIPLYATRFLECFAETYMAQLMLEQGLLARQKLAAGVDPESRDGVFYRGKMETAKYFCRNTLPRVFARQVSLEQEDASALNIPEEAL